MMKEDGKKREDNVKLRCTSDREKCKIGGKEERDGLLTELINNPLKEQMLAKKKKILPKDLS